MSKFYFGSYIFVLICCISCSKKLDLSSLDSNVCENFTFGRIELKRNISDVEKSKLANEGVIIQEYIFDQVYLGVWSKKWNSKKLEKTAIKALKPAKAEDKLASGMTINEIEAMSKENTRSTVLLQTIGKMKPNVFSEIGTVLMNKDFFYRLDVHNSHLMDLLDNPCIKLITILKEPAVPDHTPTETPEKKIR